MSTSSFNKISLVSSVAGQALSVSGGESCGPTILTAIYTPITDVDSISWEDPTSNEISTTATAVAEDPGEYTFTVNLTNGCSVSETITID